VTTIYQVGDIVRIDGGWQPARIDRVHRVGKLLTGYKVSIPSTGQRLVVRPQEVLGLAMLDDPDP